MRLPYTLLLIVIILAAGIFGAWSWFKEPAVEPEPVVVTPNEPVATTTDPIISSHDNLIRVTLASQTKITSPVTLTGQARGYWYFEASFPIKIVDSKGELLGSGIAQAQEEWMTENFVPFSSTITFTKPTTATGTVVFLKDNPSGLPEHEDAITVPVTF